MSALLSSVPQPQPADDDSALLARVARQDRHALRQLYDRLGGQALAVASRILSSRVEAEEALHDAFVDVWRRAAQYSPERGSGRTWVLSVVRNRAIDQLRSRSAAERAARRAGEERELTEVGTPDPHQEAELRQRRDRMRAALSVLSETQRHALQLAYFDGLSQSEIADRLQEPLGTIKTRLRAALEKLSRQLGARESSS